MPGERPAPKLVVIDGLNVCHGGANGEGWDGRRLLSCISKLESMGYGTIPVIGRWRLKDQMKKKTPGFKRIEKLQNRPAPFNLRTTQGQDDILVLRLAVSENAWIITQDGFGKEREKYPQGIEGTPWEEIDKLTVGTQWNGDWLNKGVHWNAQGSDFVWIDCPITEAPKELLIDEFNEERTLAMEAKRLIERMHGSIESKVKGREEELQKLLQASSNIIGNFGPMERSFPEKKIGNASQINGKFKLDELRKFCSDRGISKTGKKDEVIRRLIEFEGGGRPPTGKKTDKEVKDKKKGKKEKRKELMDKIDEIGNAKLIEEIRSNYLDIFAEDYPLGASLIDQCLLYVEDPKNKHAVAIRINLICRGRSSEFIGKHGRNVKILSERTAKSLGCDEKSFKINIRAYGQSKKGVEDYSKFLMSFNMGQLRDFLSQLGLPKSGNKKAVVNRIINFPEKKMAEHSDKREKSREKATIEDEKDSGDIIGFTKTQFASALMECKGDSQKREPYSSVYSILISKRPEFNLKELGIKPNVYLEECSELIDFEIVMSEGGGHKHYWI